MNTMRSHPQWKQLNTWAIHASYNEKREPSTQHLLRIPHNCRHASLELQQKNDRSFWFKSTKTIRIKKNVSWQKKEQDVLNGEHDRSTHFHVVIKIRRLLTHRATIHNEPQKARSTTWDLFLATGGILIPREFLPKFNGSKGSHQLPHFPTSKTRLHVFHEQDMKFPDLQIGYTHMWIGNVPFPGFLRTPSGKMTMSADVKSWYISDIHCKRGGAILELSKNLRIHQPF